MTRLRRAGRWVSSVHRPGAGAGVCSAAPRSRAEGTRAVLVDNDEIIRSYVEEVWNRGRLGVADLLLAAGNVSHDFACAADAATVEQVKQRVRRLRTAFPDLQVTIDDLISAGNLVAARLTVRGTHEGIWMGIAPTRQQATWTGTVIFRLAGGKIVERWGEMDVLYWS